MDEQPAEYGATVPDLGEEVNPNLGNMQTKILGGVLLHGASSLDFNVWGQEASKGSEYERRNHQSRERRIPNKVTEVVISDTHFQLAQRLLGDHTTFFCTPIISAQYQKKKILFGPMVSITVLEDI